MMAEQTGRCLAETLNLNAEVDRRKRRRSFKNQTICNLDDLLHQNDKEIPSGSQGSHDTGNEWEKLYLDKLNTEITEWKNIHFDTKCKLEETKLKCRTSRRRNVFDESLLTREEKGFLGDVGIYKEMAKNFKILEETAILNAKLKATVHENKFRKCRVQNNELLKVNENIYKSAIDMSFDNIDFDGYESD